MARGGVGELLGPFVGGEAIVTGAAKGRLFPGVFWRGDDLALGEGGGYGVWVLHFGDAEVGGPAVVLAVPAGVNVVELVVVLEVGPVNGKLVVCVEFGLELVVGGPWIRA